MAPQEHRFDSLFGRRLFSLGVPAASALPGLSSLPSDHFACFIAWDAQNASTEEISTLVEPLLQAGASYFVCWGPDCERVHDVIDEIATRSGEDSDVPKDSCIMTTWHDDESLQGALWFFLVNSLPDGYYQKSTRVSLAISVGSTDWMTEIVSALEDPRGFVESFSGDGAT